MKSIGAEETTRTRERLHYLDWLRVLAVVGVFYAHSINIFDMLYWHIRSGGQSSGLIVMVIFGTQWGMSLFFFLAGASTWFALKSRTTGQFIGERFKRLIIPFIVGFILLSPPRPISLLSMTVRTMGVFCSLFLTSLSTYISVGIRNGLLPMATTSGFLLFSSLFLC